MRDIVGRNVTFHMVHRDERFALGIGQRLGIGHAGEQRTHQPRPGRHGHRVDVLPTEVCLRKRPRHHIWELFHMVARSNLRHDATILLVNLDLRIQHIGQHLAAVLHNSRCCLVTGGLDRQDPHLRCIPQFIQPFLHLHLVL